MTRYCLLMCGLWLVASVSSADDFGDRCLDNWHQWRGPLANGVAPRGDPPVEWGEQKNIKWKTEVAGEGHATPIVWRDQVFVVSAVMTQRKVDSLAPPKMEPPGGYKTERPVNFYSFGVTSFDRTTGEVRWKTTACEELPHEGRHGTNSYASGSPTTDGKRLYVSFGSRGIYCFDLTGELLWKRDLGDMITRRGWGEGVSPVVHGDNVIVNWDHEGESFLAVLDPGSGETKWQAARDEVTSWATPLVVSRGDCTQVIVPATRKITSYDLANGRVIWECGGLTTNVIPCPVVSDDLVICMSGHGGNEACAIRLDSRGDLDDESEQIAWRIRRDTPYVPSPLLYGDLLFFTKSNSAILSCVDAASGGFLQESTRLPDMRSLYASPVGAAGRIYFTSREGVSLVVKNQAQLEVMAVNTLPEGIDASPAIVGSEMFVRGRQHLYCLARD